MYFYNMIKEVWKPVVGYEGYYLISNYGNIKSLDRYVNNMHGTKSLVKGKVLKQFPIKNGYLQVYLMKDGVGKWFKIHRLVAMAFIPNPNNLPCINHKDCNPTNNTVLNLEWCDWKYNNSYGDRLQKIYPKISKVVYQYDIEGNFIKEWPSARIASRELGINISGLCLCCKGERKYAGGYIWKYKSET